MTRVKPLILVVDDEADSLARVTDILCAEGYAVCAANSGELAIESAFANAPDLILLDLDMPGMDGLEVCRRLKKSEATREVPMMFISGSADAERPLQCWAEGAVDFVTKPFHREELAIRVRTHVELGHLRANLDNEVALRTAEVHAMAEEFRHSRDRLEAAADLAGLAFYEFDLSAGLTFFDDRMRALSGIPLDQETGLQPLQFWQEHLHPDDAPGFLDARAQLFDGRLERCSLEYRFLHPADRWKWIHHLACVSERDASGRATHIYGVLRDITNRKEAEEDLRRSYAEIEQLKDRLEAEGEYLRAEMRLAEQQGPVIGRSAGILKALRMVEQVAPTDSSVLVRGETGTGKELIAQAIHRLSPRHNKLMVKINCAALPSGLVESELFGREKGAYTGAMTRQIGRFEVADGSTLFLDEIGELPLDLQAKLLRVLESGEFERLGSSRTIKVDVRVIAATNRDLVEAIRQGKFRDDLYYRLNVFPIQVPALRERSDDIPLLVWAFLQEFCTRMGKKITEVPKKTMDALQRHSWPGNIRELRNVIEHGAIITIGEVLRIPPLGNESSSHVGAPCQTLADVEREHILKVLNRLNWHIKGPNGAAAELGINPGTLYGRMKKLGIQSRTRVATSR